MEVMKLKFGKDLTKDQAVNLIRILKEHLEHCNTEPNPLIAYGYLKSSVESIVGSAEGDIKYKFLRISK